MLWMQSLLLWLGCLALCRGRPAARRTPRQLLCVTLWVILTVTVLPVPIPPGWNPAWRNTVNLEPFRDVVLGYGNAKEQVVLNLLLTAPLGLLLPLCFSVRLGGVMGGVLLVSVGIEGLQLLTAMGNAPVLRRFDVTDILANVTGAVLGYLLLRILAGRDPGEDG